MCSDSGRSSSDSVILSSSLDHNNLVEQVRNPEIHCLLQCALETEAGTIPVCYYKKSSILINWRPPDVPVDEQWSVVHQIVVPRCYQNDILSLAHDHKLWGHLSVKKTFDCIRRHFYWPKMRENVVQYCGICYTCQLTGKPNQNHPKSTLETNSCL